MRKILNPETKRIPFVFSKKVLDVLEWIKKITDSSSMTEVVKDALLFYSKYIEFSQKGYEMRFVKDNDVVQLFMPKISAVNIDLKRESVDYNDTEMEYTNNRDSIKEKSHTIL